MYTIQFTSLKTSCTIDCIMMTSHSQVHRDYIIFHNIPWRIYQALTIHATLNYCHFFRSHTFLENDVVYSFVFATCRIIVFDVYLRYNIGPVCLLHAKTVLRSKTINAPGIMKFKLWQTIPWSSLLNTQFFIYIFLGVEKNIFK